MDSFCRPARGAFQRYHPLHIVMDRTSPPYGMEPGGRGEVMGEAKDPLRLIERIVGFVSNASGSASEV